MDKILLDNMTGQEIKELIADEIITLQELDVPALEKVLDFEIEMICHGNGDMDIMRQCSEILDERSKSDKLNHDDILAVINKTKEEQVTIINADNACPSVVAPQRKIRFVFKRIAIVAAAIIIMMTTTVAIAAAFGVNIFEYIKNIASEPDGTTVNIDEFTFYNAKSTKKYNSIQEMVESENLDIMYPTRLPDGVDIESIRLTDNTNGNNMVQISTNIVSVNIQIELRTSELISYFDKIYENNEVIYYIRTKEACSATCYYKNNYYYISANTYEDLILIINNMKE